MAYLASGKLTILGIALLADVAGPGPAGCGCGSDSPQAPETVIAVSLTDCSCATEPVTVQVDGVSRGTLTCSTSTPFYIAVVPGSHQLSASSTQGKWPERAITATPSGETTVGLGCPSQ
jgi:hypothetical protein